MLKRIRKDDGMTLIEVIVSMLVLSIAVVTVMTAFSMASKVNLKAKQQQGVESLMENLLEYAEGGGADFKAWFTVADGDYQLVQDISDTEPVRIEKLKKMKSGFQEYTVRVTTDTNPTEYTTEALNDRDVIQFGGAGSNTILIDASKNTLGDYFDNNAYTHFQLKNAQAVLEHNEEEREAAGEGVADDELDLWKPYTDMHPDPKDTYNLIDREVWLETVNTSPGKMQLVVKMVYKLYPDSDFHYPDGESLTYVAYPPVYVSEIYDEASSSNPTAKKLNQIYLLYSDSAAEHTGDGIDIRILDAGKLLDANIFFAYQETGAVAKDLETNDNYIKAPKTHADTRNKELTVSFKDPDTNVLKAPKGARISCSAKVNLKDSVSGIEKEDHSLSAKGKEVRVVKVTLEILDANTDAVLETKTVTRLQ